MVFKHYLNKKNLSFISFISAIETLVNEEYRDENNKIEYSCNKCKAIKDSPFKCEVCGNPTWAIGYKFKEFL
jgi:rubrerythrin